MILAQNSLFMIANSNTANFADFKYFGVPTIEYTHYSDELLTLTKYPLFNFFIFFRIDSPTK